MVFQRPVMLRRSALANVRYALWIHGVPHSERRRRADEAIEHFGLQSIAHRTARVLSGGEQQRLALARAWSLRPEILFMDEPTSALDPARHSSCGKGRRGLPQRRHPHRHDDPRPGPGPTPRR